MSKFAAALIFYTALQAMIKCGDEIVATVMQKRDKPDGATCIGSGRIEEIKEFAAENEVDQLFSTVISLFCQARLPPCTFL